MPYEIKYLPLHDEAWVVAGPNGQPVAVRLLWQDAENGSFRSERHGLLPAKKSLRSFYVL